MIEVLLAKPKWTKMIVGRTTLASVHRGDSVRIPNNGSPAREVELILPDGQLLAGGGYVGYTSGISIEIFCPHKHN